MLNSGLTPSKSSACPSTAIAMTDFSLNETASRARLAAKGAGYPWGLADEVYRSVFWLVRHNLPAPLVLSQLLKHYKEPDDVQNSMPIINGEEYTSRGSWLCPVMLGCAMTDRVDAIDADATIKIDELKCPLLLLPFVIELATKQERVARLQIESTSGTYLMATDGQHMHFSSPDIAQLEHVTSIEMTFPAISTFNFDLSEALQVQNRVVVDSDTWSELENYAHHTYAPATEASRNLGAGAGTTDND